MGFFGFIESTLGSHPFVLLVVCTSFILKIGLLFLLIKTAVKTKQIKYLWILLATILVGDLIENFSWIIKLSQILFIPHLDYRIVLFIIRIAWSVTTIQYAALALFVEGLVTKQKNITFRQRLTCIISLLFCSFFLIIAFINFQCTSSADRSWIELTTVTITPLYSLFILMLSIIIASIRTRGKELPAILKKQVSILIKWLLLPQLISDLIQTIPLFPYSIYYYPTWITNSYAVVSISTILLTMAMYFCAQKMIGLRFLNFRNHVEEKPKLTFIDDFKVILQRLSHVTTLQELVHITQVFFKDTLSIPFNKTMLHIRSSHVTTNEPNAVTMHTATLAETLIETYPKNMMRVLNENPIFIYDEIDFSNFYNKTKERTTILHFLNTLNADIFLPIFEQKDLVGYIIIDRHARLNSFYNALERDEMIVFASYLGNIIHLLKNKSLEVLIERKQQLTHELLAKHKEIEQYKESMRSFLRTNAKQQIGVICYHNRHFTFSNAAAKELIPVNINVHEGHPVTQALKRIAQLVESYKAPQTGYTKDPVGNTLVLSALPHLEKNKVIITVSPPNVSDIIKKQVDILKNQSEWDFLLYLETTKSGRLINQLIPGTGSTLLQYKIDLLKASLSSKAILLDVSQDDMAPMVELLHVISLRETLHTITLNTPVTDNSIAIKLFGINPLFGDGHEAQPSLLKKLADTGTLYIQNVHFLDIETQNYLAEFIKYGVFRIFKSDQKIHSNVRIICSSNQNLRQRIHDGTFSTALYDEISHTKLILPSLLTLPDEELQTLADGFSEQALKDTTFERLLLLNERDKQKLTRSRPTSLVELKKKVHQIVVSKSKQHDVYDETQFNPAYEVTDPDLIQAKCLGRRALRDRKIMTMLWDKFKNQSDIAIFLGVNRSSINRRCKEYNLQ